MISISGGAFCKNILFNYYNLSRCFSHSILLIVNVLANRCSRAKSWCFCSWCFKNRCYRNCTIGVIRYVTLFLHLLDPPSPLWHFASPLPPPCVMWQRFLSTFSSEIASKNCHSTFLLTPLHPCDNWWQFGNPPSPKVSRIIWMAPNYIAMWTKRWGGA